MTQADKALLRKIKKLFALAGSANIHEASAALSKAQQMMEDHNLTQALLDMPSIDESQPYRVRSNAKVLPRWIQILHAVIKNSFGVLAFRLKVNNIVGSQIVGRENLLFFVGPNGRAELASYAFIVLYRQLLRARDRILTETRGIKKRSERINCADWFCEGWVAGVAEKLKYFSLSPAESAAMEAWEADRQPLSDKMREAKKDHQAGVYFFNGKKQGQTARLYKPVNGQNHGTDVPVALPYLATE